MNKTEKLLPCPFCGQQPTEYAIEPHTHALQFSGGKMPDHQGSHVIECACGCGIIDATREEVFSVWNRRPTPCLHQIQEPEADIWPCVNIDVDESGKITNAKLYSPGLRAGNHDVYPVRVPYMDEHTEAWRACVDELEKAMPGFMSLGNMNGIECAVAAIQGLAERAKHQEPAPVLAAQPDALQALRALHDSVELAMQRGSLSERALEIIIMQPATDVLMRAASLAAPAVVAVPDAVRDALLQSEAALEVAIARILKSDPGHSISVTSEAKALVAVRAAIAATTAAAPVLPEPDFLQRHEDVCGDEVGPPTAFYTADTVRALLATVTGKSGSNDSPLLAGVSAPAAQAAPAAQSVANADGRFTKNPVTIDAIKWTGSNLREVIAFTDGPPDTRSIHAGMAWEAYVDLVARDGLKIYTLEGKMLANIGDWIIRGIKGEYYPCKPDIFEATYTSAPQAQADARDAEQER